MPDGRGQGLVIVAGIARGGIQSLLADQRDVVVLHPGRRIAIGLQGVVQRADDAGCIALAGIAVGNQPTGDLALVAAEGRLETLVSLGDQKIDGRQLRIGADRLLRRQARLGTVEGRSVGPRRRRCKHAASQDDGENEYDIGSNGKSHDCPQTNRRCPRLACISHAKDGQFAAIGLAVQVHGENGQTRRNGEALLAALT
ncbi:hypothetical protein DNR46_32715 [Mesorhizobium japonicum]|uniref:Uncharacterized protein n=1 Tax=Mesorhizobium japonicum TaxID=2066070 RepID=A0A3M9X0Q8_9HYPH|nr:hypothetical protein DNR46_32715 [Mesorhizobium japonicum]